MGTFRVITEQSRRCRRFVPLLVAIFGCACAGAAPVVAGDSGARWAMGSGVHSSYASSGVLGDAGMTTLHELLTIEESAAPTLEQAAAPLPEPGQALAHALLADLDTALRTLREAGYDGGFVPARETGQGAFLRVAQRTAPRSGLY